MTSEIRFNDAHYRLLHAVVSNSRASKHSISFIMHGIIVHSSCLAIVEGFLVWPNKNYENTGDNSILLHSISKANTKKDAVTSKHNKTVKTGRVIKIDGS